MPLIDGEEVRLSNNTAGFMFVSGPTTSGKWQAKPTLEKGGKQKDLGSFDTPQEAAVAAARAIREHNEGTLLLKEKQQRLPRGSKRERCGTPASVALACRPFPNFFVCIMSQAAGMCG